MQRFAGVSEVKQVDEGVICSRQEQVCIAWVPLNVIDGGGVATQDALTPVHSWLSDVRYADGPVHTNEALRMGSTALPAPQVQLIIIAQDM